MVAKASFEAILGVNPQLDTCGSFDGGRLCECKMFVPSDDIPLQFLVGYASFDFTGEPTIVDLPSPPGEHEVSQSVIERLT